MPEQKGLEQGVGPEHPLARALHDAYDGDDEEVLDAEIARLMLMLSHFDDSAIEAVAPDRKSAPTSSGQRRSLLVQWLRRLL